MLPSFEMIEIPSGSFLMGSDEYRDELPVHPVAVGSFEMGKYPVTQKQWQVVMGDNPSYFKGAGEDCPVEQVSWDDAQEFIKALNALTGQEYRLPTEAEWEYACRAGSTGKWCFGDDESELGQYAWHRKNSDNKTHPVGKKKPNAFGLHDLHGNVWEWCQDGWHNSYKGAPVDAREWVGDSDDKYRVLRGGSWINVPQNLRAAYRFFSDPAVRDESYGFRLARTI
jgi:formylglycine-generating enzyme required for sulfatase activity